MKQLIGFTLKADCFQMRLRISIRGRVRRSVRRSIPCYFRMTNMAVFEETKSSKDIKSNDTISEDEVLAFDVPPR